MERDLLKKLTVLLSTSGTFLKFSIFPQSDTKRMTTGVVVFEEKEARRLWIMLQDYFENRPNDEVEIKDLRNMQKVSSEYRVRTEEARRSEPISAEEMQRQNLVAEGRLEPQALGDVAVIEKKKVI